MISSAFRASRKEARPTPSCWHNSRSGGICSPSAQSPRIKWDTIFRQISAVRVVLAIGVRTIFPIEVNYSVGWPDILFILYHSRFVVFKSLEALKMRVEVFG